MQDTPPNRIPGFSQRSDSPSPRALILNSVVTPVRAHLEAERGKKKQETQQQSIGRPAQGRRPVQHIAGSEENETEKDVEEQGGPRLPIRYPESDANIV